MPDEDESLLRSRNEEQEPKQGDPVHYEMKGEWDGSRYTVHETDNIITEYKLAYLNNKGRPGMAQQMIKESYRLEPDKFGRTGKKPVEFDKNTGVWKNKNLLSRVLVKEPPVVIGMLVNGADGAGNVLHTFESNRPVNDQITRVEGKTGENLNIELVLKTAQAAEEKRRKMNKILEQQKFLRERSRQAEIQRISQQHLQQHLRDMHMV